MKNDVKVVIVFSGMPKPEKVERVKALLITSFIQRTEKADKKAFGKGE